MAPKKQLPPGLMPFWMINDAATVAERIEYMRACKKGGINALTMHSRAGNLTPYGSTEWFEMIRALVKEAHRLNMNLWLYDEDPFPSGAAGGMVMAEHPELTASAMAWHEKPESVGPGELWVLGENKVLWVGLVPADRPGPAKELPMAAGAIRIDWATGPWDSRFYYFDTPRFSCEHGNAVNMQFALRSPKIPKGFKLAAITVEQPGEEGSWKGLPDLLNPASFGVFERLSIGIYKKYVGRYFGTTIPGIFTDEAKPHGYMPITGDLFTSFQRRYGYDLRTRIHHLFGTLINDEYAKTRIDYRRWVAERFLNVFVKPYRRWCDHNNLLLVGHCSPEDDPIWEAACIGAVQPIMRTMSLPGTDIIVPMVGDAKAPCLNLGSLRVGSIRSQAGTGYGISESWGATSWTATTEVSRRTLAWQRVLGVNRFFPHGFFTSNDGVTLHETPPDFGPHSSVFPGVCAINDWILKCDEFAEGENEIAPVAIVDGLLSYWDWAPDAATPRHEAMRRNLWNTILACLQAHVGVHMLDEGELARGRIVNDQLVIGKRRYRWVLAPDCERMSLPAVKTLERAWKAGVLVWWFGGGPSVLIDEKYRFRKTGNLPGAKLDGPAPSLAWCRRHLPALAGMEGKGAEDVYLRRFTLKGKGHFLMAANLADTPANIRLIPEGSQGWNPISVDGDTGVEPDATAWQAAARGWGLFKLEPLTPHQLSGHVPTLKRETGANRTFKRLADNVLRLDKPLASWGGNKPERLPFPKPYWSLTNNYSAKRSFDTFLGSIPIESRMPEDARLIYRFDIKAADALSNVVLSMDPRFARGRFNIMLNGRRLGDMRDWPLMNTIKPERVLLPRLTKGIHVIEFRFEPGSAMDGLLAWAYLEGAFDLELQGATPVISKPAHLASKTGWQASGMPHYMGQGRYHWTETLSPAEAESLGYLELERIIDSAELKLNGRSLGLKAWSPWRWKLSGLKPGANRFELTVNSAAGNKFALEWPNQPQGWLGKAWLC